MKLSLERTGDVGKGGIRFVFVNHHASLFLTGNKLN